MGKIREPIKLIQAKGKKHLTKREIEVRENGEIVPCTEEIEAPKYLLAKQKREFSKIAGQLKKLKIMGETDCDVLAMYIVSKDEWNRARRLLNKVYQEDEMDMERLRTFSGEVDRAYKRCILAARELGLTITGRCRLVLPKIEEKKENKFTRFMITSEKAV